jgi:hypothetical protein
VRPVPPQQPGTVVRGTLVAARAAPALPAAGAAAEALPAARRGTDPPRGVPGLAAWMLAAAALVSAGCLRERRDVRAYPDPAP